MKKYITILLLTVVSLVSAHHGVLQGEWNRYGDIQSPTNDTEKVVISPNPAMNSTMVKIMDNHAKIAQISVYSLLGNQIFVKNYNGTEQSISLNIQSFKKGKYLIKVSFKDGSSEVKALIKQ